MEWGDYITSLKTELNLYWTLNQSIRGCFTAESLLPLLDPCLDHCMEDFGSSISVYNLCMPSGFKSIGGLSFFCTEWLRPLYIKRILPGVHLSLFATSSRSLALMDSRGGSVLGLYCRQSSICLSEPVIDGLWKFPPPCVAAISLAITTDNTACQKHNLTMAAGPHNKLG